ncbi:hypothetical protein PILCRDRAFT_822038 [Piloderma croceum F 1598]|uniref:Uncharacterized protein n=1 Tax=Piloderma croceum (strain F 1598) TaxID=765440 RepID=A0A0C3BTX2_PILCF|nr:hypothetical protein PILCRDRAFT_822038 [Piloderma croceum F 1598]
MCGLYSISMGGQTVANLPTEMEVTVYPTIRISYGLRASDGKLGILVFMQLQLSPCVIHQYRCENQEILSASLDSY